MMNVCNRQTAPRYQRDGITSFLLASHKSGAQNITITLVEMEVEGFQQLHKHTSEQTYTILEGSGVMAVDGVYRHVESGDCIFIPSWVEHGLENTGNTMLKYLSAASPSFTLQECIDWWPLPGLEDEEEQDR